MKVIIIKNQTHTHAPKEQYSQIETANKKKVKEKRPKTRGITQIIFGFCSENWDVKKKWLMSINHHSHFPLILFDFYLPISGSIYKFRFFYQLNKKKSNPSMVFCGAPIDVYICYGNSFLIMRVFFFAEKKPPLIKFNGFISKWMWFITHKPFGSNEKRICQKLDYVSA